jgi:glycosyltransferase involved in cell wall biosynthesis
MNETHPLMTPKPLFSVVTPSFNQGRFLEKTIQSVLEQDMDNIEHIVADGASTDDTLAVLQRHPHLQWFSEKDSGQSEALNKGIARARGEWIVWINSDDYLLPGALRRFADFIAAHPSAQFIYSHCIFVDEHERTTSEPRSNYSPAHLAYWWRGGAGFPQPGTLFRRDLWERFGPYDNALHYTMDYDFWLKISKMVRFEFLDAFTAAYRIHGQSKTGMGNLPFFNEKLKVTRRYWDAQGGWMKWKMRLLLHLQAGRMEVMEGIRLGLENNSAAARPHFLRGFRMNPLALLAYPHLCYRLRQLLGTRFYDALRARRRG